MKISIRNINRTASVQGLRELFMPFGDVLSASLVLDRSTGRSRGMGQVEMRDAACGDLAIAALNNTSFMAQRITVAEVSTGHETAFNTHF